MLKRVLEEGEGGEGRREEARGGREVASAVSTVVFSIITEGTYNPAKSVRRLFMRLFTAFITNNSILSLFSPSVIEVYTHFTVMSLVSFNFPLFTEDTDIER